MPTFGLMLLAIAATGCAKSGPEMAQVTDM